LPTVKPTLDDRGNPPGVGAISEFLRVRSDGRAAKHEVWYLTASDAETGAGLWIHYELVKPVGGPIRLEGWLAFFDPPDPPLIVRQEVRSIVLVPTPEGKVVVEPGLPASAAQGKDPTPMIDTSKFGLAERKLWGCLDGASWELEVVPQGPPLFTFPKSVWGLERFPGAQIVPMPDARVRGVLELPSGSRSFSGVGGLARIYGNGSAHRWAWVHANPSPGVVLEVVSAVPRVAGGIVKPLSFVQLRTEDGTWPEDPLRAAAFLRSSIETDAFEITGKVGRRRMSLKARLPAGQTVRLVYNDPDGSHPICVNSEVADLEFRLEKRNRVWEEVVSFEVRGRAHAEVGYRD
jgi:hypothetical protein